MNVLVVATHPDDEILGPGGTLLRLKAEGHTTHLMAVTNGNEHQARAMDQAHLVMGFSSIRKLCFPENTLWTTPKNELIDKLITLINTLRPEIVFSHFLYDINDDHQVVSQCVRLACRPQSSYCPALYEFETLSSTEWGDEAFKPNWYCNITGYLTAKISAFECYTSEQRRAPYPRNAMAISTQAQKRGSEALVPVAEAFRLVRKVI